MRRKLRSTKSRERDGGRYHERGGIGRLRRGSAHDGDVIRRQAHVTVGSVGGHLVVIGLAHDGVAVDEGKRVLDLEAPFVMHLDLANLFGRLAFLRARDCKAAEVFHLFTAGIIGGAIPRQPNSVFCVGGLEAENLFGTRGLRRNRRRLHTASEEDRVGQRGNHERERQRIGALRVQLHRRPSSLRRRLTVDGAGPPSRVRRATEFSARRIAIASVANTLECRRRSAMLKSSSDLPAAAVSRTIAPTISCAWRNAVPRTTRYSARSVAKANPPAAARMRRASNRSIGQNFAIKSSAGLSALSASNTRSLSSCKSEL